MWKIMRSGKTTPKPVSRRHRDWSRVKDTRNCVRSFVTYHELRKKGVATGTLKRLRDGGLIRFKRIGRQYHYAPDDVDAVLGWPQPLQNDAAVELAAIDADVAATVRRLKG